MSSCGFIYVATGSKYVEEAIQSAMSVRSCMPGFSICLFTDLDLKESKPLVFDLVKKIPDGKSYYSVRDKIWPLAESPFDRSIFLDTDTSMVRSVNEIFDSLKRYDVMVAHDPNRAWYPSKCPDCIQEINTGLIAFQKNERTSNLFMRWGEIYSQQIEGTFQEGVNVLPPHDQPAFKEALYEVKLDSYILTPEYNVRTIFPMYIGKGLAPAILHGRNLGDKFSKICKKHDESTVVFPSLHLFNPKQCIVIGSTGNFFIQLCQCLKKAFMLGMRTKGILRK